jgi:hypothetical protein
VNIVFDPQFPMALLFAVSAGAAALLGVSVFYHWRAGVFRAVALAALIGLLFNPLLRQAEKTPLDDIAVILADKSASLELGERNAKAASAVEALSNAIESMPGVELRLVEFEGREETLAVAALQTALADTPRARLAGVFIVTDGQAVDGDQAAHLALDAPVHLIVAGDKDERDRKVTLLSAPRYGIVGQPVRVSFRIDDFGFDEKPIDEERTANVTLRLNGDEVLTQPVPFGVEASFDAPLERPGRTIIELEVESRDDELTARNNIAVLPISAIRDRLRVLLISGEPHPGERVWRNLLKSDPAVDLVHFTILRPIEKNSIVPNSELALIPFPQNELFIDQLSEFDLLIFDRYTYRGVLSPFHFDNIARYVERGGAVLIAAGPEFYGEQSLAERRNLSFILPATPAGGAVEESYRPEVTELGARHPVAEDLPEEGFWGRWLRIMPVEQRSGETLLAAPSGAPLLILDRVGLGRVGLFLSDHVWLWARGFDGGGPHAELLRRIAHWLMKEPELEEEALALISDGEDLIIRRRTIGDAPPPVSLTAPDGQISEHELTSVSPGLYEKRIAAAPRGLYRVRSVLPHSEPDNNEGEPEQAADTLFAVGAVGLEAAAEFQDVVSNRHKLAPLADATGGGVFSLREDDQAAPPAIRRIGAGTRPRAGAGWAGLVARNAARVDAVRERPLLTPWQWLAIIGAALTAAWLMESGRLGGRNRQ